MFIILISRKKMAVVEKLEGREWIHGSKKQRRS